MCVCHTASYPLRKLSPSICSCEIYRVFKAFGSKSVRACVPNDFSHIRLRDPMDCSPPGSSVHGILQAGILGRVARPSSRGLNLGLRPCRQTLYALSRQGSPDCTTHAANSAPPNTTCPGLSPRPGFSSCRVLSVSCFRRIHAHTTHTLHTHSTHGMHTHVTHTPYTHHTHHHTSHPPTYDTQTPHVTHTHHT